MFSLDSLNMVFSRVRQKTSHIFTFPSTQLYQLPSLGLLFLLLLSIVQWDCEVGLCMDAQGLSRLPSSQKYESMGHMLLHAKWQYFLPVTSMGDIYSALIWVIING